MLLRNPIFAALTLTLSLGACGDDPRPIAGNTCSSNDECESGMCFNQQCLAPVGAPCAADSECATGLCAEDICAEPASQGETQFFLFGPKFGVEHNITGGTLIPGISYSETLGLTRDGITVGAECIADAFFHSPDGGAAPIRTTVRCFADEPDGAAPFPYASGPGTMTVANETEDFTNEFGHTETADPYDTHIIAAGAQSGHPADADVLVGQGLRTYAVTTANGTRTDGRELNGVVLVRKSADLQPAAVQGDWGFVTFQTEASAGEPSAQYGNQQFAATIGAAIGGGGMTLLPTGSLGFGVRQGLARENSQPLAVNRESGDADDAVPLTIERSGAALVGEAGSVFSGAVSPAGDFMVLYDSSPAVWPPFVGEGPLDTPNAAQAAFTFMWGVKRAADPIATLAGKRYRIIRFAVRAGTSQFAIAYNPGAPSLTFDPAGAAATLDASEDEFEVGFAGGLVPNSGAVELPPLDVSLGHAATFALNADGEADPLVSGYVSHDGRLVVFADASTGLDPNGNPTNATTGIAFGVCTNCDDGAAN